MHAIPPTTPLSWKARPARNPPATTTERWHATQHGLQDHLSRSAEGFSDTSVRFQHDVTARSFAKKAADRKGAAQRGKACAVNGTATPTAFSPRNDSSDRERAIEMTSQQSSPAPQAREVASTQATPCTVESAAPPTNRTRSAPGQPSGTQPPSPVKCLSVAHT